MNNSTDNSNILLIKIIKEINPSLINADNTAAF